MRNRDAVLMVRIEFPGGQQMFEHADHWQEQLIDMVDLFFTEFTNCSCPVGQIVQPVAFLHQLGTEARCEVALQSPFAVVHHILPL